MILAATVVLLRDSIGAPNPPPAAAHAAPAPSVTGEDAAAEEPSPPATQVPPVDDATLPIDPDEPRSAPALALEQAPVDVAPLPAVAVEEPADFGGGLVAVVTEVAAFEATSFGPGETSGPAAAVHIEIRNETGEPVNLDGLAVNATDGNGAPLVPNFSSPAEQIIGMLEPGEARTGIYVFRVDAAVPDLVIEVHHDTAPQFVVIET